MECNLPIEITGIYLSSGHDFKGHHGGPRGDHSVEDVGEAECVAGKGLRGDRYFGHAENFKGQITFFEWSALESLRIEFNRSDLHPSAVRRNVVVKGVDLNTLVKRRFEIEGVRFEGSEECSPCYWMDEAVAPGAEAALRTRGGLRARILKSGLLRRGRARLLLLDQSDL